jgi:hypothetical protein
MKQTSISRAWAGFTTIAMAIGLSSPLAVRAAERPPINQQQEFNHNFDADVLAAAVPKPRPEDVASPENLVRALHDAVSGSAGTWDKDRFRSLLLPSATFVFYKKGAVHIVYPADIVKEADSVRKTHAWHETIDHIVIHKTDAIATAFYHQTAAMDDQKPVENGHNVCEMIFDGKRWWIVSDIW